MENEFYEEPNLIVAQTKAFDLTAEMDTYLREDEVNKIKLRTAAATMMNIICNDFGHSGLELECPMCSAYIEAARLLYTLKGEEMPEEVLQWDKRKYFTAKKVTHNLPQKVNIPDPSNPDARIVGFRIYEGDEAWGEHGLSEPLFWLEKITK